MSKTAYPIVWDLEVFFKGGSESPEFRKHLDQTKDRVRTYAEQLKDFKTPKSASKADQVAETLNQAADILMSVSQAGAFVSCLEAQDMSDQKASALRSEITEMSALFNSAFNILKQKLAKTDENVWNELLNHEKLSELNFVLNEWRTQAQEQLSEDEEALITALSVDGYHAWGQMYNTIVGGMTVTVNVESEEKELSVGQANNLLSHENPEVRKEVFEKLEATWKEKENLFAKTLNHLAGFRLNTYQKRGWDNVLKEPLDINRMQQDTLYAMWGAISKNKDPFVDFLYRKAKLLGKEKLEWYDLGASTQKNKKKLSYDDGAAFILEHFEKFSPKMANFAKTAFEDAWIEAEDRPGKRPGGFCTGFPLSEQSRIFMTYSGSMSNVATLAHELGHAFHSYALKGVHPLNRRYAMNVAETASTFAEMIVADASLKQASSESEKVALLEDKLQRSVAFFMNIHSRFLFETRFYEERKNGFVPASRLNELTDEAQREAYCDAVNSTSPSFWANKLHFHITGVPFYNFPYTFGYLFSLSIYAKALEEGTNYEDKYMALLRDTAVMTVEDLAMKHLGEDITKESFWEKGIELCKNDVKEYLSLTE
ncbi:M3 family oligoendopeptidase [Tenuibacillus multivorans]|uniref:Oligoendopeptidase, pepF/M3 family n=1 Tax=Tenuibacillus multivorans TaxID=237069 RepID=A0A1H0B8W2_9BACI|nr:M3 family oligoendopeptidase [Tenuibacillus multivorans]GEL78598.1 oligoendopeptidase [Tenuibacillus multivorans]SDN42076.1 oligoendopeptidase, pepF/M3 family [Tenuibacillus multivorans]